MRTQGADRIWPEYVSSVGGLIAQHVIVRFACLSCREIFDVDLQAVAAVRGRAYSLLDRRSTCRRSSCRGTGCFIMAEGIDKPFVKLAHRPMPAWLRNLRPCDVDAPPDGHLPPGSPAAAAIGKRA
jgi:hypothetical protein